MEVDCATVGKLLREGEGVPEWRKNAVGSEEGEASARAPDTPKAEKRRRRVARNKEMPVLKIFSMVLFPL